MSDNGNARRVLTVGRAAVEYQPTLSFGNLLTIVSTILGGAVVAIGLAFRIGAFEAHVQSWMQVMNGRIDRLECDMVANGSLPSTTAPCTPAASKGKAAQR